MSFFKQIIKDLIDNGNVVDIATNESTSKVPDCYREWGCLIYNISTSRSLFKIGNLKAIKEIKTIAKNYDIVHCHTPIAGAATRMACKSLRKKNNLKVVYTAHGFHFYHGSPKKNWLLYYPVERVCSRWTDVLITINNEDYNLAKAKMKASMIEYIPGVGVNIERFKSIVVDRAKKRRELGISENARLLLSVGELNRNKNHQLIIKAIAELHDNNVHYMIAGVGGQADSLTNLAKSLNVNLHLLGYRKDVAELYKIADLYIHPSLREGLPVAVIEAIASGCIAIGSRIRGNSDLIPPEFLFDKKSVSEVVNMLNRPLNHYNCQLLPKTDVSNVCNQMIDIYEKLSN